MITKEEDFLEEVYEVIEHNNASGYGVLFNFPVLIECLEEGDAIRELTFRLRNARPNMDTLNLICTMVGAFNYVAEQERDTEPWKAFESPFELRGLLRRNYDKVWRLCSQYNNSPTVPQRVIPFACHASDLDGKVGVLDLGCSRGDAGLVWLDLPRFLQNSDRWFFPTWNEKVKLKHADDLAKCKSISQYVGVDVSQPDDDNWLLSLWGLQDPRRASLVNYYHQFRPRDGRSFCRIAEDAANFHAYLPAALKRFSDCDHLVIICSFMVYQLSVDQRRRLCKAVQHVRNEFLQDRPQAEVRWLIQGLGPKDFLDDDFSFDSVWLSQVEFDKRGVSMRAVAHVHGDLSEGWEPAEETHFLGKKFLS